MYIISFRLSVNKKILTRLYPWECLINGQSTRKDPMFFSLLSQSSVLRTRVVLRHLISISLQGLLLYFRKLASLLLRVFNVVGLISGSLL